jgi:hypothetical protein
MALLLSLLGGGAYTQEVAGKETATTTVETVQVKDDDDQRISPGGLMIEPMLSVSREDTTIQSSQLPVVADDTSGTIEGFGAGLRLGIHASEVIFLGVDGRYNRIRFTDSFYEASEGDMFNVGPGVVVRMPVAGLRAWGTYVMAGQFDPGAGVQGLDVKFTDAEGYRLGLGLRFAAVSVNVEYQNLGFDSTEIESFGSLGVSGAANVDFENQGYSLSLSFPVEL